MTDRVNNTINSHSKNDGVKYNASTDKKINQDIANEFSDVIQESLIWYQEKLGFVKCSDNKSANGIRWLTISPSSDKSTQFILTLTQGVDDQRRVGSNSICALVSDNCYSDCEVFAVRGVEITQAPMSVPWGVSATICDLYGNPYNIVEFSR